MDSTRSFIDAICRYFPKRRAAATGYRLTYLKPPWTRFWQESEHVFLAREQDRVYFFTRIFGPSRFEHRVFLRWELKDSRRNRWITSDRIPLPIKGGRDEGYRGYTYKENYQPGEWRVEVETEDGRVLEGLFFELRRTPPWKSGSSSNAGCRKRVGL